jgi:hypothetical protein
VAAARRIRFPPGCSGSGRRDGSKSPASFGSKAALFAAVLERAVAEIRASLDDLAAGFGSAPAPAGNGGEPG